jgi:hypothetical protein
VCARKSPDYDVINQPEDEPIILAGPPQALFGEVLFHNPGAEKVVLRDARLSRVEVQTVGEEEADEERARALLPESAGISTIVLRPGQRRSLPLQLNLNPHTPPGDYRARLETAGRSREVIIHVTEFVLLDISPSHLVIENIPGSRVIKRVVFTNRGNTTLHIGDFGAIPLDDERFDCRMLRSALEAVGDETHPLEEYVAEIARQSRNVLQQAGNLRVKSDTGPFDLQPGEIRAVDLEIRVPDSLDRRTRYNGSAAIYTSDLNIVIVPAQAGRNEEPDTEKPPRKKTDKS